LRQFFHSLPKNTGSLPSN